MDFWSSFLYKMWSVKSVFKWLINGSYGHWDGGDNSSYHKIFGFLRLRLDPNPGGSVIEEINGCSLIREVHVYGQALGVGGSSTGSQHRGFGKLLVKTAEEISVLNGYKKAAVIAGVGTREYYKNKCGFTKGGTYMLKDLKSYDYNQFYRGFIGFAIASISSAVYCYLN